MLGLRISRAFFDSVLEEAVPSGFDPTLYPDVPSWKAGVATSDVRLQWDPDHDPSGAPVERRAIQLGLRNRMLRAFASEEIREIIDMTAFVHEQAGHARTALLRMPAERPYMPEKTAALRQIGLDPTP